MDTTAKLWHVGDGKELCTLAVSDCVDCYHLKLSFTVIEILYLSDCVQSSSSPTLNRLLAQHMSTSRVPCLYCVLKYVISCCFIYLCEILYQYAYLCYQCMRPTQTLCTNLCQTHLTVTSQRIPNFLDFSPPIPFCK